MTTLFFYLLGLVLLFSCSETLAPTAEVQGDAVIDLSVDMFIFDLDARQPDLALDTAMDLAIPDQGDMLTLDDAQVDQFLVDADPYDASLYEVGPREPVDSPCPDDLIRGMIGAHMPDGRCYLIDARPVNMAEYWGAELVNGPLRSSSPYCEGFESNGYRWSGHCADSDDGTSSDGTEPEFTWPPQPEYEGLPMHCITWCDAGAYCESLGKRLCNSTAIESWAVDDYDNSQTVEVRAENDEWFSALTGAGTLPLPDDWERNDGGFRGLNTMSTQEYVGPFPMLSFMVLYAYSYRYSPPKYVVDKYVEATALYGYEMGELPAGTSGTPERTIPRHHSVDSDSERFYFPGIRCCADATIP